MAEKHMPGAFRVLVYDGHARANLMADLTNRLTALTLSTIFHGGFKQCSMTAPMSLGEAYQWLDHELPGFHFYHLVVYEQVSETDRRVAWEGRILDIGYDWGRRELLVDAFGYWSSLRDQKYDAADAGNTDWTGSGPHTVDKVVKELLTKGAPDINTDQGNIDANSADVVGLDLTARAYLQDIIVDKLAPLSDTDDSLWYAYVYEDRIFRWKKRSLDQVDFSVRLSDAPKGVLRQKGKHIRNRIRPVAGSTEGTAADNADSQVKYPIRELDLSLPDGVPTAVQNDARDLALEERRRPWQSAGFTVTGHLYGSDIGSSGPKDGALVEVPKWRIRAGHVIRIQDLVPATVSTPTLDNLRTFWVTETVYDAFRDVVDIQPDRAATKLGTTLARIALLERDK